MTDPAGSVSSTPPRLAVDADGYVWRVYGEGEPWSMAPSNPDNSPIPEPVTFYEPVPADDPQSDEDRIQLEVLTPSNGEGAIIVWEEDDWRAYEVVLSGAFFERRLRRAARKVRRRAEAILAVEEGLSA